MRPEPYGPWCAPVRTSSRHGSRSPTNCSPTSSSSCRRGRAVLAVGLGRGGCCATVDRMHETSTAGALKTFPSDASMGGMLRHMHGWSSGPVGFVPDDPASDDFESDGERDWPEWQATGIREQVDDGRSSGAWAANRRVMAHGDQQTRRRIRLRARRGLLLYQVRLRGGRWRRTSAANSVTPLASRAERRAATSRGGSRQIGSPRHESWCVARIWRIQAAASSPVQASCP